MGKEVDWSKVKIWIFTDLDKAKQFAKYLEAAEYLQGENREKETNRQD